MSRENVELAREFTAAYNAGDMGALKALCTPDVAGVPDSSVWPESGPVVGRDALASLLEDSRSTWEHCVHELKEVFDVGDGRVVARGDWVGTGSASGIETSQSLTPVFTVREGRISRVEWFFDHAKALDAVGLRE